MKKALWFICLFAVSMLNLYMMHRFQAWEGIFELGSSDTSWAHVWLSILFDCTVLFFVSLPFCGFRVRGSLLMSFFLTLILCFLNVQYGRHFHLYFSPLLLLEWQNVGDSTLVKTVVSGFTARDLYFPIAGVGFFLIWLRSKDKVGAWLPSLAALYGFFLLIAVPSYPFKDGFSGNETTRQLYPNSSTLHLGLVHFFTSECKLLLPAKLSEERQAEIRSFYEDKSGRVTARTAAPEVENLIFILVESYSAESCDLVVDGKEITPFLNGLKKKDGVYFNAHMQENIVKGESSDGQIIYMTGLLPLRKAVTVSLAKNKTLPGLPGQLGIAPDNSRIIVPTNPSLWQQENMNIVYGIGKCYSHKDYSEQGQHFPVLDDPQVFRFAGELDRESETPFFSLVLTLSMHSPYTEAVTDDFTLSDSSLPDPYLNYLIACHQMDALLEEYFRNLEESGLLDRSLIVITGDHAPHSVYLGVEPSRELPLFIINGGFDPGKARQDTIQQLDVYTSVLDIMGSISTWRGLGHSILSPDYAGINEELWQVSEDIILSDFFASN